MNTQEVLNHLPLQVDDVKDERLRDTLFSLLNLIEALAAENSELRQENQRLRDEINRLKGEQGKPKLSGSGLRNASRPCS
jgi:cell shape-determining protein MreC